MESGGRQSGESTKIRSICQKGPKRKQLEPKWLRKGNVAVGKAWRRTVAGLACGQASTPSHLSDRLTPGVSFGFSILSYNLYVLFVRAVDAESPIWTFLSGRQQTFRSATFSGAQQPFRSGSKLFGPAVNFSVRQQTYLSRITLFGQATNFWSGSKLFGRAANFSVAPQTFRSGSKLFGRASTFSVAHQTFPSGNKLLVGQQASWSGI